MATEKNFKVKNGVSVGTNVTFEAANAGGVLSWNSIDQTLDITLNSQVTLQTGQETLFYAKATGAIANGDVVMFAGAQGDHLLIAKADMQSVGFKPEYIIGVATQSFNTNDFGFVTAFGKVRGLNTSAFTEGTILYLNPSVAGALTSTAPTDGSHVIQMAAVVRQHATEGTLFVRPLHKVDLDELPSVNITNLQDGQALVWDSATSKWVNGDSFSQSDFDTAFGLKSINALSDVDTNTVAPTSGQVLKWNGTNWTPANDSTLNLATSSINDLGDVDTATTAPTSGQALVWNGTNFVPGDVTANFLGLTDTPNSYTGQANKVIQVNSSGNALEFVELTKLVAEAYTRDTFTGDGSTTTFNLSSDPGTVYAPFVFVDGVIQDPLTGYNIDLNVTPKTITFTFTPANGSDILVLYGTTIIAGSVSDGAISFSKLDPTNFQYQVETGDGTTTDFALDQQAVSTQHLIVTVASVPQSPDGTTYTVINSGNTIRFASAPANGAKIVIRWYGVATYNVPVDDSVSTAKIQNLAVTTAKIANNAVTSDKIANGSITADKIADGTIVAAEIADGTITPAKLDREYATKGTSIALSIALG